VPITRFQSDVLRLLAAQRSPDSYIAGGVVINRDGPRISDDIDIFHDTADRLESAVKADAAVLTGAGYIMTWPQNQRTGKRTAVVYADAWIEHQEVMDPDTGQLLNLLEPRVAGPGTLQDRKSGSIANSKDFRNEVVKFSLRTRANNNGKNPSWTSDEKIREVIDRRMFNQVGELLPVIASGLQRSVTP
jgi:hypothetical protein